MKKETKIKAILMIAFAMLFIIASFAEIGIATMFNITYNGVCYRDYVANFYSAHPVMTVVTALFLIGMSYAWTWLTMDTYHQIKNKLKNKFDNI